jgi:hypothetical protein
MRPLPGLVLLLPMVVLGQDQPLLDELLNAKTALVEKPSYYPNYQYCSGDILTLEAEGKVEWCKSYLDYYKPLNKKYIKFLDALKKWGHFSLVEARSQADVIISPNIQWQSAPASIQRSSRSSVPSLIIGGHYPTTDGNVGSMNTRDHTNSTDANGKQYITDTVSGTRETRDRSQTDTTASGTFAAISASSVKIYGRQSGNLLFWYYTDSSNPTKLVSGLKRRIDREERAERSQ